MPKGKPWTVKEESSLKQLLDSGERLDVIAAKMGKSKQAVYLKARRLGLKEEVTKHGASSSSNEIELPAKNTN